MAGRNAQKADVILKDFWRQNERFADLFNAVVFRGKHWYKQGNCQNGAHTAEQRQDSGRDSRLAGFDRGVRS